jgi:hypothetical protein
LADVADNPRNGDKVQNRREPDYRTRTVKDRTFGSDVIYVYDMRRRYERQCTLAEWRRFCKGATLLRFKP